MKLGGGEIADGHRNGIPAGLLAQPGDHGRGQIDPLYSYAALTERQRDATGADAQLERLAVAG